LGPATDLIDYTFSVLIQCATCLGNQLVAEV
jgi:hypothetical protein